MWQCDKIRGLCNDSSERMRSQHRVKDRRFPKVAGFPSYMTHHLCPSFVWVTAANMSAAQSIPRFLLPRLSWTSPLSTTGTLPRASAVVFHQARQTAQAARECGRHASSTSKSFHTACQSAPKRQIFLGPLQHDASSARPPVKRLSSITPSPELRRSFHVSAARQRDHHFDTLRFVQRLQAEGFTEEQAVALMRVLNDVIEER